MSSKIVRSGAGDGKSKRRRSARADSVAAQPKIDAQSLRSVPLPLLFPDLDWTRPVAARTVAMLRAAQALAQAGDWDLCADYAAAAQRGAAHACDVPASRLHPLRPSSAGLHAPGQLDAQAAQVAQGSTGSAGSTDSDLASRGALGADACPQAQYAPNAAPARQEELERASLQGVEVSEVWYERIPPKPFDWAAAFDRPWDDAGAESSARERLCVLAGHAHPRFVLDWTESVLMSDAVAKQETRRVASRRARAAAAWVERALQAQSPGAHVELCGATPALVHTPKGVAITRLDLTRSPARSGHTCALPMARRASAAALPLADASVASLSCLSVIEHAGLDVPPAEIDYDADLRSVRELRRVLAPGGQILLALPLGQPRLPLHGPRIYSYRQVLEMFRGFELSGFELLTDQQLSEQASEPAVLHSACSADSQGMAAMFETLEALANSQQLALGCFRLTRPPLRHAQPGARGAAGVPLAAAAGVPAALGAAPSSPAVVEPQSHVFVEALVCGHGLKTLIDVGHLSDWPRHVRFERVVSLAELDAQALTRCLASSFQPALVRVHAESVSDALLSLVRALCLAPDRGHAMLIEWAWDDATLAPGLLVPNVKPADVAKLWQCVASHKPSYQVRQADRVCIISSGVIPGDPMCDAVDD